MRDAAFVIEDRPEGRTLVVTGRWTPDTESALSRSDVEGLWLNYARGFCEPGLEFVKGWPLRRLLVLDRKLTDLGPLARLGGTLEDLDVQASPSAVIDVGSLPRLTSLGATWRQIRESVALGGNLRDLFVLQYDERDLWALAENERLTKVVLKEHPLLESLSGAQELQALTELGVFSARSLTDISDLAGTADRLRRLELQACPGVESFDVIAALTELRFLNLSDCRDIESLAPAASLRNLEAIHAWGSTRVLDGDLSSLASLPRLAEIRMRDRPEYRPRVSEFVDADAHRLNA